jgi:hypothetical protein
MKKHQDQQRQRRRTCNNNQDTAIAKQLLQQQLLLTRGDDNNKHTDAKVDLQQSLMPDDLLAENEDGLADSDKSSNAIASEFEDSGCFYDSLSPSMLVCPECDSELTKIYDQENYAEWHYFCDNCSIRIGRNSAVAVLLEEDTDNYNNSQTLEFDSGQTLHLEWCT